MDNHVPLDRQFWIIPESQESADKDEIDLYWGFAEFKTWIDLDREFRCVILAEAGAGKTEEMRYRASLLADQGKPSFFIRIEDIEANFDEAFEVGTRSQFRAWLQSTETAWFFLDSVDEARIESPRAFEKAIRRFAKGISRGAHRAHICLSSRPYAWRPRDDRQLLNAVLFHPAPRDAGSDESVQQSNRQSALKVYAMRPLDQDRIRQFCLSRAAENVDRLLQEVERANIWNLAERPFDLEGILSAWAVHGAFESRLELLRHNIDMRLRDDHSVDRAQRQPLNLDRAKDGARRLAAAVVLTGGAGLNVPDAEAIKPGVEAEVVLADWDPRDVRVLLERALFDDIVYGAVRFRHRDVRELLAAEWFDELLRVGNNRFQVETLIFREQYGETVVTPRLRPILPWLILMDQDICRKTLGLQPEIAIAGGDPSQLPLLRRRRILRDIARRIVSNGDDHLVADNSEIARIADPELSNDVIELLTEYGDSDDAVFFLGRLVWQGRMASCVAPFVVIAAAESHSIHARTASARAVLSCGSVEQKRQLWELLNSQNEQIPCELVTELVREATPSDDNVAQLIVSLGKVQLNEQRYETIGLHQSLHAFVERIPIVDGQTVVTQFIEGLHGFLSRQPFVERVECHVSEEYAWLISPAIHAVERLVEAQSATALDAPALSIMLMAPTLRYWGKADLNDYKTNLNALVPRWPELNDALYWTSIEQMRNNKTSKSSEPLTNDWLISWLGHYWNFDIESLPRLYGYMRSRAIQEDRLVALSTAFRVYAHADKPAAVLDDLQDAVADDSILRHQLDQLLDPPVSEESSKRETALSERKRKVEADEERRKKARDVWIAELRANPERVCNSKDVNPGEWTNDQYWLLNEIRTIGLKTDRSEGANWRALIPEFGEGVAQAYRDAAIAHWRNYVPTLQSEGVHRDNTTPYSLIFAMAGLEIEASESPSFPSYLDPSEVRHALRYITWELNGFPGWFERVYREFPSMVEEAVTKELLWELEHPSSDKRINYIISDLAYYAPWLHESISPVLLDWMKANPTRIGANRRYCIEILANGGTVSDVLSSLADIAIRQNTDPDDIADWHALRVDCDSDTGIPGFERWISSLDGEKATRAAQIFVTSLLGPRRFKGGGPYFGSFRTAEHLKALYVLMHHHIRVDEDIDRSDGRVFSPGLRDDAQDARHRLFTHLSAMPGKASYTALKQLIREHPNPKFRPWMAKQAFKRAEEDSDIEPWTAQQVFEFAQTQTLKPETHRQLFDITIGRLIDLKNWLERGNDSPYLTWQRAKDESEMRNLILGWFNQQSKDRYTTAQEPELANNQRMDIWIQNATAASPIPIELKLLDKKWSGPSICERLRVQLVGSYLREENARFGVMLLISQQIGMDKKWEVNSRRVGLVELASAVETYWRSIADQHLDVEKIGVVMIDLSQRDRVIG